MPDGGREDVQKPDVGTGTEMGGDATVSLSVHQSDRTCLEVGDMSRSFENVANDKAAVPNWASIRPELEPPEPGAFSGLEARVNVNDGLGGWQAVPQQFAKTGHAGRDSDCAYSVD